MSSSKNTQKTSYWPYSPRRPRGSVKWNAAEGKWEAFYRDRSRNRHSVGLFDDFVEALEAAYEAKRKNIEREKELTSERKSASHQKRKLPKAGFSPMSHYTILDLALAEHEYIDRHKRLAGKETKRVGHYKRRTE